MASSSKKKKVESEIRIFQQSWVNEYFVIEQNNKPLCLICRNSLSVNNKEYNIKRHYSTNHSSEYDKFLGEERITKAENLKKLLDKQQTYFIKSTSESENSVKASYIISQKIAKHSKSFSDGEFIKDCILAAVKLICPEYEKKFDNISLSRRTVTRRIGEMSNDIKQTLNEKIKDFQWYSLAVDESKDITDSAQLCIFIRGIDKNFNITEELLSLSKLQTTTTGNDIFIVIKEAMKEYNLKYHNMSGISTDGAKSMVGKNIGAMAYFKNDMGESEYKDKLNFHCLIHQQNLCSKIISINDVMTIVVKCINEIKSKSSLRHREFLTFLDDMELAYRDLIYYCDVRWLSRGAMLKRF